MLVKFASKNDKFLNLMMDAKVIIPLLSVTFCDTSITYKIFYRKSYFLFNLEIY